jgi:murein L,D-transpeptidase YcbB/YkuD
MSPVNVPAHGGKDPAPSSPPTVALTRLAGSDDSCRQRKVSGDMRILPLLAILLIGAAALSTLSVPASAKNADQSRQELLRAQTQKSQNVTPKRKKQQQPSSTGAEVSDGQSSGLWQRRKKKAEPSSTGVAASDGQSGGFWQKRKKARSWWGSGFSSSNERSNTPWYKRKRAESRFAWTRQPGDWKRKRRLNFGIDPEVRRPKSPDDGFEVYDPPALVALNDPTLQADPADPLARAIVKEFRQAGSALRVTPAQKAALIDFYRVSAFAPLWVAPAGLNDKAWRTLAVLANAEEEGLHPPDYLPPALDSFADDGSAADGDLASLARIEIGLSAMALRYAEHLYSGRIVPKRLSGYYDLAPPTLNLTRALFELSSQAKPDLYLSSLAPPHPAYSAMRESLAELRNQSAGMDLEAVPALPAAAEPDDAGFSPEVDPNALAKLVLNMERTRWLPRELGQRHVFVNQAAFELRLIDGDSMTWRTKVIVGKPETQTAVFSDRMETVVINPYWGVPQSIIRYEFMPRMAKDRRYLERNGYEVLTEGGRHISSRSVNWWAYPGKIPFAVRQLPGDDNALGRIKFLFPNSHDIYMHDTPTRELFEEEVRAFSHGCVRVENPREFAEHVLGWDRRRIDDLIATGQNQDISLDRQIPVHLQYFTAWPDESGIVEFHSDIYGRDARLAKALKRIGVSSVSGARQAESQKAPPI